MEAWGKTVTSSAPAPCFDRIYWQCQPGQVQPERLINISL